LCAHYNLRDELVHQKRVQFVWEWGTQPVLRTAAPLSPAGSLSKQAHEAFKGPASCRGIKNDLATTQNNEEEEADCFAQTYQHLAAGRCWQRAVARRTASLFAPCGCKHKNEARQNWAAAWGSWVKIQAAKVRLRRHTYR
jgi:hypothetical protein